ncbi:MAG: exosortase system-associated protein, TIGR04073 family [Candidatus Omnitrophica bacterium]|nr:exosortase system-associated protein, TIGR04073 family [Candidatus Omnitrophota bacterium]
MRKVFACLMVMALVLSVMPAFAAEGDSVVDHPAAKKLGRGLLNIVDAVCEIPGTMMRTGNAEGAGKGLTVGLFNGVKNTVVRAVVGAYEVVSFPFPVPADYEPILDEPQYLAAE